MSGNNGTAAAQHAGLEHSHGGGGVTVSRPDKGAGTALACQTRLKSAAISHVHCRRQVGHILYKAYTKLGKKFRNYRSDVIHKIKHSNTTPFQFYTLPILHSSNPTLFQSYTLPILHFTNPSPSHFQSYTLLILHPSNFILFQSYIHPILHSSNLTLFNLETLPIAHLSNLKLF